ncbi:MAG: helix-turn-helix domain-containing protein [Bacteroidaceae bacterium]|nr:helix-turn-helix domain-containing protein [Bacteroidaceae bacterium]
MHSFRRYILLLFSLLAGVVSRAQEENPLNTSVAFSYLTIEDGLSSNTVRALMQDRLGFVWIGTSRGLNRYDGHRIVPLHKTRSLSVTSMAEDGDSIWVGTDNGLFLYLQRTDSVRKYIVNSKKESIANVNVADLRMDAKGNLWLATMGQGMMRIDTRNGQMSTVPTPDGGASYGCLYISRNGTVWASGNWAKENLIRYDEQKNCFVGMTLQFANPSHPVVGGIAMTEDDKGKMWLGTWSGALIRFDGLTGQAEEVLSSSESQMQHIHSLMELKKNCLLVGSDKGLAVVDVKTKATRLHNRGSFLSSALSDNFVYPLMVDREGGTWVGTYYGGVNYTHPVSGNFTSYVHSEYGNSVSGNVVNHFCEDLQNRLWIASDDGGLCYYHPGNGTFTKVRLAAEGAEHNVHALAMDGDQLYVGTYTQGIDIVDVNTMQVSQVPVFLDEKGQMFDASSYAICCDRQHRIWVGTFDEVAIFHPDTRTFSDVKKVEVPVLDILQDLSDCLWVATDGNGVWAYNKQGEWKHYLDFHREEMAEGALVSAYSLFQDGQGTLWVGMANGLFRYDREGDRFEKEPLPIDGVSVLGITAVEGRLWLATSAGVLCYSLVERKLVQIYKGGGNIASIDFLPDAVYRGYDGRVYLGTTNGFVAFKPQFMNRNGVQPKVVFTGLDIFNRPVPVGGDILPQRLPYLEQLRLSYRESVFRITFSAMSYLNPSDIHYSYYLEGFDEDWIDAGSQQSVTYTNLSPGTYTLHVRATTNDGLQSDDATLSIVITPPFYWNTPAKLLYLLLIVLAIFFYVRYLLKKNEKRHVAEIQEINTQKEQEIQEINTQKEQEIQEINIQKEQDIQEINIQKEQEVHDARIKFMTINDKDQAFLDKMETVIEQNFSNPDLTVDYLASELSVSRSGLFAKIKTLADVTPNEMIQVIRLKHAASLLVSGNYRVNEVCYMVGFSSPSYFAKCFQKQYGCTPAKYKG